MNKGQNPYSITLEENVGQTVHQLKVALAIDAVYFTYHWIWFWKLKGATSSTYVPLTLHVITGTII